MMNVSLRRSLLLSCAWIGSCLLAGALLWFFTQSLRGDFLRSAANRVIARSGESRRLYLPAGRAAGFGSWWTLNEVPGGGAAEGQVLVFKLMNGTQVAVCAAFVDENGRFEKIIPLSDYAEQVVAALPGPVYNIYVERIAAAAKAAGPGRKQ